MGMCVVLLVPQGVRIAQGDEPVSTHGGESGVSLWYFRYNVDIWKCLLRMDP